MIKTYGRFIRVDKQDKWFSVEECGDLSGFVHSTHIIRLGSSTIYSYVPLTSKIGEAYAMVDCMIEEGVLSQEDTFHITIISTVNLNKKRKPSDPETVGDRLRIMLMSMVPPKCNLVVNVVRCKTYRQINHHFSTFIQWPLRKRWKEGSGYITIHDPEPRMDKKNPARYEILPARMKVIEFAHALKYDIKFVDYCTPLEELIDILANSEMHFTYPGSTGFLAPLIGTPTVHLHNIPMSYKWAEVGDEKGIMSRHIVGRTQTSSHRTTQIKEDGTMEEWIPRDVTYINNNVEMSDINYLFLSRKTWTDSHMDQFYWLYMKREQRMEKQR